MAIVVAGAGGPIDEYRLGKASVVAAGEAGVGMEDVWGAIPGKATPPKGCLDFSLAGGGGTL